MQQSMEDDIPFFLCAQWAKEIVSVRLSDTFFLFSGGLLRDRSIPEQDAETVRHVLAPKVAGTRNIGRMTPVNPLSCFCGFSSVAASIGSAGQCNYVAANSVIDATVTNLQIYGIPGGLQNVHHASFNDPQEA
jgi:hypothetical protein